MSPKYQIFVSSTYEDLKTEREAVTKAVLELGHTPVGMEMFSAADEEQWQLIARQIDSSDYYIVLVAHRYGSLDGSISYTEKEYDYAAAKGIPRLGFIIDENAAWPPGKQESDPEMRQKLALFKAKVRTKPVSWWSSGAELQSKVLAALAKAFGVSPRPGWLPAGSATDPALASEVARLSKENAELREALRMANASLSALRERISGLSSLDAQVELSGPRFGNKPAWKATTTWAELFARLAPTLMKRENDMTVRLKLGELFGPQWDRISGPPPRLDDPCFETVKIQLIALGFVSVTELPTTDGKHALFWDLTQLGRLRMLELRSVRGGEPPA